MNRTHLALVLVISLLLVVDIVTIRLHWGQIEKIMNYQTTQAIIRHLQTEDNAPLQSTIDGGTTSDFVDDGGGWE